MAKKVDLKAKQKRQKVIAAVGGVMLLGVLAIQVPKTMKMLNAQPPPTPVTTTELSSAVPANSTALPTPGAVGTAAAAAPTQVTENGLVADSDPEPVAGDGQLIAFGTFSSKDPFAQQVRQGVPAPAANDGGGATSSGAGSAGGGGGGVKTDGSTSGSDSPVGIPDGSTPPAAASAGAAVLGVNGVEETVAKGAEFPKEQPIFRLVSVTRNEVKVAIAGGALASGARTVSIKKGKTVTLVNTADGTRYELKFVGTG